MLIEIKEFLDEKVVQYNEPSFIETDPIFIPHQFSEKKDIEIAGFLTSIIAWGQRPVIIRNALKMMSLMDNAPYDFVMNHQKNDLKVFDSFVHRTFNSDDLKTFVGSLNNIYENHDGLEGIFSTYSDDDSIIPAINALNNIFFSIPHLSRTRKHISSPERGSAAKRINMFLRWMVRNDNKGVDFGLWKSISPSILSCPLDIHSGNVARKLGLITRKQNDIKSLNELDRNLRIMDAIDPVKYDFALFGLGIFEDF